MPLFYITFFGRKSIKRVKRFKKEGEYTAKPVDNLNFQNASPLLGACSPRRALPGSASPCLESGCFKTGKIVFAAKPLNVLVFATDCLGRVRGQIHL